MKNYTHEEADRRIKNALDMVEWGSFDGSHHKMWAIDQILRALTGCTRDGDSMNDDSNEYKSWLVTYEDGEEGPSTYEWDMGLAP